jgi:hypothetical protein
MMGLDLAPHATRNLRLKGFDAVSEKESGPIFPGLLAAVGQDVAGGDDVAEDETGADAETEDGRVDHQIIHGKFLLGGAMRMSQQIVLKSGLLSDFPYTMGTYGLQ